MKRIASLFVILSLLLSGCYNEHNCPPAEDDAPRATLDIALLRTICQNGCVVVDSAIVCEGRVTSSDFERNFYGTLVVEDASGGVEVKLGTYSTANRYPVGLKVSLCLKGTALMLENGVVQIGLPPQSFDSSPREMGSQVVVDRHIIRSLSVEDVEPLSCNISSLNLEMCGRLVEVANLRHAPLADDEVSLAGYHRFEDADGNAIFTNISPYATFADEPLPDSEITLCGILYRDVVSEDMGEQFVIKPRSKDDIRTIDTAR